MVQTSRRWRWGSGQASGCPISCPRGDFKAATLAPGRSSPATRAPRCGAWPGARPWPRGAQPVQIHSTETCRRWARRAGAPRGALPGCCHLFLLRSVCGSWVSGRWEPDQPPLVRPHDGGSGGCGRPVRGSGPQRCVHGYCGKTLHPTRGDALTCFLLMLGPGVSRHH